jgi:hypothetical protein
MIVFAFLAKYSEGNTQIFGLVMFIGFFFLMMAHPTKGSWLDNQFNKDDD